ncbi:MAG TPA: hypothetical protein VGO57_16610 [Verrucomicrobiae bacterium]|jgi:hypothetical protein
MIKSILKWVLRLFIVGVVLIVIFLLSLNSILRVLVEHNIRAQTGMDAEIGSFKLGLLDSTVTIRDLKIYNPAKTFGGTLFLSIPEVHLELDRDAIANQKLHFNLVRFNLGELDIVRNEAGATNIFELGLAIPKNPSGNGTQLKDELKHRTGLEFAGIDTLNVSVGTLKYIDLKDQRHNRTQNVDVENQIIQNVKSPADLTGLAVLIGLRSGDFFTLFVDPKAKNADALKLFW